MPVRDAYPAFGGTLSTDHKRTAWVSCRSPDPSMCAIT